MPPLGNISLQLLELLLGLILFLVEGEDDFVAGLALNYYVHVCTIADAIDLMPHVAAEICVTTRSHQSSPGQLPHRPSLISSGVTEA